MATLEDSRQIVRQLLQEYAEIPASDENVRMDLKFYLEDGLGKKVDLVSRKMLKPLIREKIEREAIDVS